MEAVFKKICGSREIYITLANIDVENGMNQFIETNV